MSDSESVSGSSTIEFSVDGSEKMRINHTGNVGIGTNSPIQKLHIHGGSTHSYLHFSNTDTGTTDSDGVDIGINTSEEAIIWQRENNIIKFGTNSTERMRITSAGNVGIGTTSPSGKLHSYISANRQMGHNAVGGDLGVISDNNSAPVLYVKGTGTADLVNVLDNTTNVFTIKDGGNVGIGTTSPAVNLHVDGIR